MDLGKIFSENFTGAFSRVKQYTQEKLGTSEKTDFGKSFEDLVERCEKTRVWTEKLLARVESVLQPDPNARAEDFLLEKIDQKRDHQSVYENLSQELIEAGGELGAELPYGAALLKTGKAFQNIARAEREYVETILIQYVQPLKKFLEKDIKEIDKERKLLETKRLDLDAWKGRIKKMKSSESKLQAEQELRIIQAEFDRQIEITKLMLEGIDSTHANHLRRLQNFVDFQRQYYSQCHQYMAELQRELNGSQHPEHSCDIKQWDVKGVAAERITEFSVRVNEVVSGLTAIGSDSRWTFYENGNQRKKSSTCLEIKPAESTSSSDVIQKY